MSSRGFFGQGGANDIGTEIRSALVDDLDALLRVGLLEQLEELPLFVQGVDQDITSDISTPLMFTPLARFTESTVSTYPEFTANGNRTRKVLCQVWDPSALEWTEQEFVLPVAEGKFLLLVPEAWIRRTLLMSARPYYEKTALDLAQLQQAVLGSDGKLLKTPKKELSKQVRFSRGCDTNPRLTLEAFAKDENLITYFKAFVVSKLDPGDEGRLAAA